MPFTHPPQFLLLGDSIIQQSFSQDSGFAFGAALTDAYVRRLDVINRGLSGYNTSQALRVLPSIIPSTPETSLRFLVVFFGANDARLPNTPGPSQTVPVDEYAANLMQIIKHETVKAHRDVRIILITPPPVDERDQEAVDKAKYPECTGPRRTAANTKLYRDAAAGVAEAAEVACLDLWSVMMHVAGWNGREDSLPGSKGMPPNMTLRGMFTDGLHFSPLGYKLLFDEVMALIERTWPDQLPDRLPFVLPRWDDEDAWLS